MISTYIYVFSHFLSNILFYLFIYINSQFNSMFKRKIKLIIYSLNLSLCPHLDINSLHFFNHFSGTGKSKMCIFSSKHKLHLLSKDFVVLDLFNMYHWISWVKPLFFTHTPNQTALFKHFFWMKYVYIYISSIY